MSSKEFVEAAAQELTSMRGFVSEVHQLVAQGGTVQEEEPSEDEEEVDDVEDVPPPPPSERVTKARQSVSAEAYGMWNQKKEFTPPVHPKSPEQSAEIARILSSSFLFSALDAKDLDVIILAMKDVIFEPSTRIIKEGEDGDHLFVISVGAPECKKNIDGVDKVVKVCGPGDVFGELALLYNCPRAATVDATDRCSCWQLDRETFNHIVKESATKRSQQYMDFLKGVSLFISMETYERSQISDALKAEVYNKGDYIVKQSEAGDKFYIVEEGSLVAMKVMKEGEEAVKVLEYKGGDYFGELALLKDQPRAASVLVTSDTAKVLALDRKSFKKMLGPLEAILSRHSAAYE